MTEHDALPASASDAEHFALHPARGSVISTVPLPPVPSTPALFRSALVTTVRPAFVNQRQAFADMARYYAAGVGLLRTDLLALLPIDDVDVTPVTLAPQEDAMVRFAEARCAAHDGARPRRSAAARPAQDAADAALAVDAAAALEQAAQALLGEDFRVVRPSADAAWSERKLANAVAAPGR